MKKFSFALLLMSLFMVSCAEENRQLYVKDIYISKTENEYLLKLKYYDFEQEEESFQNSEYRSANLYDIGIKAMKDRRYNFRLCENIFIAPEIFIEDIDKAVYMLNSIKVSLNSDIMCFTGMYDESAADIEKDIRYPLHNISVADGKISAVFPLVSSTGNNAGALVVNNGVLTGILDERQYKILNMLTNYTDNCDFTFRDGELWAELNMINTSFNLDKDTLMVNLKVNLKDYKGISNSITGKDVFIDLLKSEISNTVYDLYENMSVNDIYNIHWYCRQMGKECNSVAVNVIIE